MTGFKSEDFELEPLGTYHPHAAFNIAFMVQLLLDGRKMAYLFGLIIKRPGNTGKKRMKTGNGRLFWSKKRNVGWVQERRAS